MDAALLLLVDGRFPAGGHTYSAGVEAAVAAGDVRDAATLERYLGGRLATTGRVDAAFAASSSAHLGDAAFLDRLDAEYSARIMSPYLRDTSRRLGRQLMRAAIQIWPRPDLDVVATTPGGPHQALALGAVVACAGATPADAAALAFHHLGAAVTSAAVRLLGLDPIELAGVQARAGRAVEDSRDEWAGWANCPPAELPADGGTLTEVLGERHGGLDARMFIA